jgi:hypothetical protein
VVLWLCLFFFFFIFFFFFFFFFFFVLNMTCSCKERPFFHLISPPNQEHKLVKNVAQIAQN